VALLDIDYFKTINDTYGHAAGDRVLVEISRRLRATVRDSDILGRWGGEEFLVVFTDADPEAGRVGSERIRLAIAREPVALGPDVSVWVTVSVGVAGRAPDARLSDGTLAAADGALYEAKAGGRNAVVVATEAPPAHPAP
jgi:diguanylate cyclase (GGDEF)-like protein